MLEKQRQQLIIELLEENTFASVKMLCDQLNASEATIRRDLLKLAGDKKIKKIRGGCEALLAKDKPARKISGSAFLAAKERHPNTKRLIAQKAVELCEEDESIIINGGSSTYMMAEFLRTRNMNILTNSFVLAQELLENSDNQITLPGGEIYRKQSIILSAFENDTIQNYHGSKMFMGTPGISEFGVMETDPLLIRAEQKLRKRAEKLIVLADSSKIGVKGNLIFSTLSDVDMVITDSHADPKVLDIFRQAGIEVIIINAAD
ncbi:DeoR/GlpR family DNA-binding transcription regulator [Aliiglaciecola sp. LCG003]|uniref:DeoR/GlpR family DNA-binding transcription regulator n=1 Tax=Aliiglaciecola sp. LCG003 TaxID=3053655 RepID=UPI0025724772|nr:DeoR/GlpR family DNA-binding transcription regulator [Aliiglaciecola sp. LCG003]WJG09691.1 DeoR/GlpR family DNA-binding transcription regulator [Aliiglaciecola sp. LCG003]